MSSCLAAPRRKQRITLNPRGNNWSNDGNKFGQKLLERMGWSAGKGLGVEENGSTEPVRVTYKNNSSGVGFTGCPDTWMDHHDDFNSILTSLNASNTQSGESTALTSMNLVEKSQRSRSRVHYSKFTRSKDLSTKSDQDMNCVFGRKHQPVEQPDPASTQSQECGEKMEEEEDGRFVNSGQSMADYFAKKLKKVGKLTESESVNAAVINEATENSDVLRGRSEKSRGKTHEDGAEMFSGAEVARLLVVARNDNGSSLRGELQIESDGYNDETGVKVKKKRRKQEIQEIRGKQFDGSHEGGEQDCLPLVEGGGEEKIEGEVVKRKRKRNKIRSDCVSEIVVRSKKEKVEYNDGDEIDVTDDLLKEDKLGVVCDYRRKVSKKKKNKKRD